MSVHSFWCFVVDVAVQLLPFIFSVFVQVQKYPFVCVYVCLSSNDNLFVSTYFVCSHKTQKKMQTPSCFSHIFCCCCCLNSQFCSSFTWADQMILSLCFFHSIYIPSLCGALKVCISFTCTFRCHSSPGNSVSSFHLLSWINMLFLTLLLLLLFVWWCGVSMLLVWCSNATQTCGVATNKS